MNNKQHTAIIHISFDDTDEFGTLLATVVKNIIGSANEAGQYENTEMFDQDNIECTVFVNKDYTVDLKDLN